METIGLSLVKLNDSELDKKIINYSKKASKNHGNIEVILAFYPKTNSLYAKRWWCKQPIKRTSKDEWHICISTKQNAFRRSCELIKECLITTTMIALSSAINQPVDWRITIGNTKSIRKCIEEILLQGLSISE